MTDYNFRFKTEHDLEGFINAIKEGVVKHISQFERFSSIRLSNSKINVNSMMGGHYLGKAWDNGIIEIKGSEGALDIADTVIHELAHILVGQESNHDMLWHEACRVLGLVKTSATKSHVSTENFNSAMLAEIKQAIDRFAKVNPTLVYHENIHIPFPEGRVPMPFQIDGIRWMLACQKNILLADEMGLGKTVEVMGYINVTKPERILVVCPNNAKLIWKRHFEEWCTEQYEVEVAYTQLYMFSDIVIMNYEAVTKWGDALKTQDWDLIVYDEGHYLKNPSAQRSKACYSIHGEKAIIITGTPIVNYPYEVFPLIHYLDRENWPEYGRFEIQFGSRGANKFGHNLPKLNAILRSTIMLRRLKKDVMSDLPKKRRQIVEFEVDDATRALIEQEKKSFGALTNKEETEMVTLVNAMRNESDTAMDDIDWASIIEAMRYTKRYAFEEMAKIAHLIARAKLPMVYEHLENALEAREKVIVFGHHRDVLESVANRFKPNAVLLMGGHVDQAAITQAATDRFNNDDSCKLFIAGITLAAGYSLKGSSTIVFIEENWVPGLMTQAEDRAHGIGRGDDNASSMLIQHLVFEDSLDTYKAKLTIKKQKSIDRAMNR